MLRSWKIALITGLIISVVAEFTLPMEHHGVQYWWMSVPAFFAAFGLVSCLLIIVTSKWLGRAWLQRSEDYYAQLRPPEDTGALPQDEDEEENNHA